MRESTYPQCRVWAAVAWVVTAALIVSAWAVMLFNWKLAFLLGGSGCAMCGVAVTLQIRSFMVRVSSLIRAANGLDAAPPVEGSPVLRSLP